MSATNSGSEILRDAIGRREETDERFSGLWILIVILGPLLPVIFSLIGLLFTGWMGEAVQLYPELSVTFPWIILSLMGIGFILGEILTAFFIYKLIKRRNGHFQRSRVLREGMVEFLENKTKDTSSTRLSTLRTIHSELNAREDEKSAGLFAIISVIFPPFLLYVMYFLTDDFTDHARKERIFFRNFEEVARDLGLDVRYPEWKQTPNRTAGLYVILTIITGLFAIYWEWVLIKDPHTHFEAHKILEDRVSASLS